MTREDTLQVLAVLKAAYPNFYRDLSKRDAESTVLLWMDMFELDDAGEVAAAVKLLIATDVKGFPPHIGAVKEKLHRIREPEQMSEAEAWGLVSAAVKNSTYGSRAEFDALPPLLQRLVGSPNQLREWALMDADTVQSVIGSNFQRSYRVRREAAREMALMPPAVREVIRAIADKLALGEGDA